MKYYFIIYALILLSLVGCSGIGGTGGTVDDTVTTPKTQKVFKGTVSQISAKSNEFIVNGVQFKHTGAEITRDSAVLSAESIIAGQIITVEAADSDEDGIYEASKIDIEEQLLGPVELIDLSNSSIQIFGQLVVITSATSFTEKSLITLEANDYLAIFGFRRDDGIIEATLIELLKEDFSSTLDTIKVAGVVTDVNVENGTIVVDGVEIQVDENGIKDINVGDFLSLDNLELNSEVPDGISTNTSDPSVVVEVDSYEIDQEIVLEGIPRRITERNVFNLNGYQVFVPVELMNAANIESVSERKVIIEGVFIGEKEVLANQIHVENTKDFELNGNLESSELENSIVVFDQIIHINRFTFINFDLETVLNEIKAGASYVVYVKGYFESEQRIASYISIKEESVDSDPETSLAGKVETIENGVLIVSGVSIRLNATVRYVNNNTEMEGAVLLTLIKAGDIIEVHGEFSEEKVFLANSLANSSLTSSEEEEVQINSDSINK